MNENDRSAKRMLVLKSRCSTRWSCDAESCKALALNYKRILEALHDIMINDSEKGNTKKDAKSLYKKICKREIAFMCITWNKILQRFNVCSKKLQSPKMDLYLAVEILKSLKAFILNMRNEFTTIENEIAELSEEVNEKYQEEIRRAITKKFPDGKTEQALSGSKKVQVETFNIIIDKLAGELNRRISMYDDLCSRFGFLTRVHVADTDPVDNCKKSIQNLLETYPNDIETSIKDEWPQFTEFMKNAAALNSKDPLSVFEFMYGNSLMDVFPNIFIAYRIYLTIPVANCSAERSFSKLALIKNRLRSSLGEERLNALSLLSIESDVTRKLSFKEIIEEFARMKARKMPF